MAEDMDTDTTAAAQDDSVAPPVGEEELDESLRSLLLMVVALVGAIAFLEIVRWGAGASSGGSPCAIPCSPSWPRNWRTPTATCASTGPGRYAMTLHST